MLNTMLSAERITLRKQPVVYSLGIAAGLFAMSLAKPASTRAQVVHHCAGAATDQAQKLLVFHFGEADTRIELDRSVKVLTPMRNPANRAQRFDVLEMWARIYKGQYRMRFIYAQVSNECVLMGQEILEYASL
jgi:hypothetical protein